MTTQLTKFKQLHHSEQALLIGNVREVQTALIYQNPGYQAIKMKEVSASFVSNQNFSTLF